MLVLYKILFDIGLFLPDVSKNSEDMMLKL